MSHCTTPDLCFLGDSQNIGTTKEECCPRCPLHTSSTKISPINKVDKLHEIYQSLQSECVPVTEISTSGKGVLHCVQTSPPVIQVVQSEKEGKDFLVPDSVSVVPPSESLNLKIRKNPVRRLHSPEHLKSSLSEFSDVNPFSCLGEVDLDNIKDFSKSERRKRKNSRGNKNVPKTRTYYSESTTNPKPLNNNYFDLFTKYLTQQEKKQHNDQQFPPENILNASKWYISNESDELVIANSHASRMMNDFHNRGTSFLIYPGKTISDDGDFSLILNDVNYLINLENITIRSLIIVFGGNDIYNACKKLNLFNKPL